MLMSWKRMTLVPASLVLLAAPALAQDVAQDVAQDLVTADDVEAILDIARTYGKASLSEQSNGYPQITGRMEGFLYQIYFLNCDEEGGNCEDLNFYLGFLDVKPTLEVINDWNYNKRFSRAYLDTDKDACVEMDLDLAVPVSLEYMESTFDLWSLIVVQFAEHIGYQ
jgi:hypothetical protein